MGDAGADAPGAADVFHLLQRLEPRHVDQQMRARKPQVQHRSERLAAGQSLALPAAFASAATASATSPGRR